MFSFNVDIALKEHYWKNKNRSKSAYTYYHLYMRSSCHFLFIRGKYNPALSEEDYNATSFIHNNHCLTLGVSVLNFLFYARRWWCWHSLPSLGNNNHLNFSLTLSQSIKLLTYFHLKWWCPFCDERYYCAYLMKSHRKCLRSFDCPATM